MHSFSNSLHRTTPRSEEKGEKKQEETGPSPPNSSIQAAQGSPPPPQHRPQACALACLTKCLLTLLPTTPFSSPTSSFRHRLNTPFPPHTSPTPPPVQLIAHIPSSANRLPPPTRPSPQKHWPANSVPAKGKPRESQKVMHAELLMWGPLKSDQKGRERGKTVSV